jgi:two-component system NarL family response regulator
MVMLWKPGMKDFTSSEPRRRRLSKRRPSVLVVDDNDAWRDLLREMARRALPDAIVHEAADGADAIEAAQRLEPDVVVTDIQMPRQDGLEVCAWLKAHCPWARVIVCTSGSLDHYQALARECGADLLLRKDSFPSSLMSALRGMAGNAGQRWDPGSAGAGVRHDM